jgi:phage-related protein
MSLDTAVVDLRQVFEFGQGYVALSRVRELSGLYLLGYNEHSLMVHPDILSKDHEFRISSGKAYLLLTEISDVTLQEIYTDFIQKCGGTIEKVPAKEKRIKINTFEQTLKLIEDGKSLAQIAKERDLATTTVIGHLERLFEKDKISQKEIEKLISKKVLKALPTIKLAFKKQDTDKLTPVFKALNEKYSFNELRLARLAIKDIKEMTRI